MKRHEVQVLRRAGVTQKKVAELTGISVRVVRMIEAEAPVVVPDDEAEREKRGIGRPSKAEPFRGFVPRQGHDDGALAVNVEPDVCEGDVRRRAATGSHARPGTGDAQESRRVGEVRIAPASRGG